MRRSALAVAVFAVSLTSLMASAPSSASPNWATESSAHAGGGMSNLIAAAKEEGSLNVIALPADWVNYGALVKGFKKKYGIKVISEDPDGTSQDEINAVQDLKSKRKAPDVLDLGMSSALYAAQSNLLSPYKVAEWSAIPSAAKAGNGAWYDDYGGYVAIGYNPKDVKTPPASLADLLEPEYKGKVALTGNPTQAGSALAAVYAAALASGGSYDNIMPGVAYFQKLNAAGNFVSVTGGPSTVRSGLTPILISWDYLQAAEVARQVPGWKMVIPSDAHYAAYSTQAISRKAPHPAASRLWEEYLYSVTGQKLWLASGIRPIELSALVKDGTVHAGALHALPPTPGGPLTFPSQAQLTAAQQVVSQNWTSAVRG
jgi:putative spermidine/putrescine transport system substrate-binding protein